MPSCMDFATRPTRGAAVAALPGAAGSAAGLAALAAVGGGAAPGWAAEALTVTALLASVVALGLLAPPRRPTGRLGRVVARAGVLLAAVGLAIDPLAGEIAGEIAGLAVAAVGVALAVPGLRLLVLASRCGDDLPAWLPHLLAPALAVAVLGHGFGGGLVLGAVWLAGAAALWLRYAAPPLPAFPRPRLALSFRWMSLTGHRRFAPLAGARALGLLLLPR